MREEIRKALEKSESRTTFASSLGFTTQFLHNVVKGSCPVSEKLALGMGYRRIVQEPLFEKIK